MEVTLAVVEDQDTLDDRLAAVAESDEVLIFSFFQRNLSLLYNKHDGNNTK